jgi:hypothetical protein
VGVEEADAHREDQIEAAVAEVGGLEAAGQELRPAVADAPFVPADAAEIIVAERSRPVSRPVTSRAQIMVAATPWPQPISSTRSPGPMPAASTIACRRALRS